MRVLSEVNVEYHYFRLGADPEFRSPECQPGGNVDMGIAFFLITMNDLVDLVHD